MRTRKPKHSYLSHGHLANMIHLKRHHMHLKKIEDSQRRWQPPPSEACLMKDLSRLKRSRLLRDPSTSPVSADIVRQPGAGGGHGICSVFKSRANAQRKADDGLNPAVSSIHGIFGRIALAVENKRKKGDRHRPGHEPLARTNSATVRLLQASLDVRNPTEIPMSTREQHASDTLQEYSRRRGHHHSRAGSRGGEVFSRFQEARPSSSSPSSSSSSSSSSPSSSSINKRRSNRTHGGSANSRPASSIPDHRTVSPASYYHNNRSYRTVDHCGAAAKNEADISNFPDNGGCRKPWNWPARIHSRGKNFLSQAGRSFSCGASDQSSITIRRAGNHEVLQSSSEDSVALSFSETSESLPLLLVNNSTTTSTEAGRLARNTRKGKDFSYRDQSKARVASLLEDSNRPHLGFAEKYAPQNFRQIVGQTLIVQALSNALYRGRVAPVYLFCGPQGTGKTSCARVLGMALHCLALDNKQRPCGSCNQCIAVSSGRVKVMCKFNVGVNHSLKRIKQLTHDLAWVFSSPYKVVIVEECHALSARAWDVFCKILDEAPKTVVFVLTTSCLEMVLNPGIVSRSQKFIFAKVGEREIVNRLEGIAVQEGLSIDLEAMRLIASTSDGSLREAERMLDQLSLLGQHIPLSMVQEMVGLIPDAKLVKLLDFALSADTVHTVQSVKELIESGVDPLTLMSQLAALITSIITGGYMIPKDGCKRKFFRHKDLSKENTERLRQALKILSEAEKQLHCSTDRMTWLTAALLQFAPDQSYLLSNSCTDTSKTLSPEIRNFGLERTYGAKQRHSRSQYSVSKSGLEKMDEKAEGILECKSFDDMDNSYLTFSASSSACIDNPDYSLAKQPSLQSVIELEDIWQRVIVAVHSNSLRQFLQKKGRLLSLSISKAFSGAHLEFREPEHVTRAQRSIRAISQAFQAVFGCPVDTTVTLTEARAEKLVRQVVSRNHLSDAGSSVSSLGHLDDTGSSALICNARKSCCERTEKLKGICPKIPNKVEGYHSSAPIYDARDSPNTEEMRNPSYELVFFESKRRHRRQKKIKSPSKRKQWTSKRQSSSHPRSYKCDEKDVADMELNSTEKSRLRVGISIQQGEDNSDKPSGAENMSKYASSLSMDQRVFEYLSAATEFERHNLTTIGFSNGETWSHTNALFCILQALSGKEWKIHMFKFRLIFRTGLYRNLESHSGGLLCLSRFKKSCEKHVRTCPSRSSFIFRLMPCRKS